MKQIKRFVSFLLAICFVASMIPVTARAAESGTCGDNLTWTLSDDGLLTISGNGPMDNFDYDEIDYYYFALPWGESRRSIKSVVVKDGVTSIGDGAFYDCDALINVTIPNSVTSIGKDAFDGCKAMTSVTIPDSVTSIGLSAFYGCYALTSVNIPSSVTSISRWVFAYCKGLTSVIIPDSVTSIEGYSFYGCDALTSVNIPDSVTSIGECAFTNCEALTSVNIPNSVTYIGVYAFGYCDALTSVTIPASVSYIGSWAFDQCHALTKISFRGNAPVIEEYAFSDVTATAYYPAHNATWTAAVKQDYGGDITWKVAANKPAAPVVKATNVASTGKIKLSWDKVSGAAKYQVYRSTKKNSGFTLLSTTTSTSLVNSKNTTPGKTYYYYVVAVTESNTKSGKSNVVSRTCDLARPEIKASNVASSGKVKLTWSKVSGAVKYEVWRAASKNGTYKLMKTTTGTSYINTKATAGKTYYYKVKAIASKSAANSALSEVKSRTCDLAQPSISITTSSGKPKVSWKKVDGATKYEVYRATSKSGTYSKVKTTTSLNWKDTAAKKGKTYYYKVVAVCKTTAGNSAYSAVKSIKATK